MSETGWPLIPREVLPAPIKPVKTRIGPRLPAPPGDPGRQLSIFGAETTEPSPADLAGLLAGPGRLGRMGGTARVSVTVDAAWRVHVLVAELVSRGLVVHWHEDVRDDASPVRPTSPGPSEHLIGPEPPGRRPSVAAAFDPDADPVPDLPSDVDFLPEPDALSEPAAGPGAEVAAEPRSAEDGADTPELPEEPPKPRFEVVTAYSSRLDPLARAWPNAAAQLFLSGPRLRLWVAAAGAPGPGGYTLGLGPGRDNPEELRAIDAALVRAGLAGRLSDSGDHYVIAGRRRLQRLTELVGERPPAAPPELWPGGAGA